MARPAHDCKRRAGAGRQAPALYVGYPTHKNRVDRLGFLSLRTAAWRGRRSDTMARHSRRRAPHHRFQILQDRRSIACPTPERLDADSRPLPRPQPRAAASREASRRGASCDRMFVHYPSLAILGLIHVLALASLPYIYFYGVSRLGNSVPPRRRDRRRIWHHRALSPCLGAQCR